MFFNSPKSHARNLSSILEIQITLDKEIQSTVNNCFYLLKMIVKPKSVLFFYIEYEEVINAFRTSPLDNCKFLYFGLLKSFTASNGPK